jgi:hypothetical protein
MIDKCINYPYLIQVHEVRCIEYVDVDKKNNGIEKPLTLIGSCNTMDKRES